ncbi:hypothetical protein DFP74_6034 [Nocardiopsis sp. Huas11]|uniref:hypothetical protein n=1 Tax=Nocardiopsis sp. Huas11 TaxID=2183912 RepID=UPI000EAF4BA9|nr:hypothetical protein [Nocardiopsis sp. Huas11]RKS10274.1 hypothetical protein DFP74_6034 [Nocardiopsis sp. Huas11]
MSAYQHYEFLALDQPLDESQRAELRDLSTRASITATSFTNEYHWGDFRGDPARLMRTHFDAFAYFAEWGTRWIMISVPSAVLRPADIKPYLLTEDAYFTTAKGRTVISLLSQDEEADFVEYPAGLAGIAPVRAELLGGDRRLLYLAWLLSVQADDELDDGELEPPVPAGLGSLSAPLCAVAEFLRIDSDLLSVAAQGSPPLPTGDGRRGEMTGWIENLPAKEKNRLLELVVEGETARARARMLQSFQAETRGGPAVAEGTRTVRQLWSAAGELRVRRAREEAALAAEQEKRRREEAAAAREARLEGLAGRREAVWQEVEDRINTKLPGEYDRAVSLLADLYALAEREEEQDAFTRPLREMRERHRRKSGLQRRMDEAGLER